MIHPTKEQIEAEVKRQRTEIQKLSNEEVLELRTQYALEEKDKLNLEKWVFLFLSAMHKMFGRLDTYETDKYFDGLELIGYPFTFILSVAEGRTYPLASLATYMEQHEYEVYQLKNQLTVLKSIESLLRDFLARSQVLPQIIPAGTLEQVNDHDTLANRIKARVAASQGKVADENH